MQVIDNVGVAVCAVAGVLLVADFIIKVGAGEKKPDRGNARGGVLDSLGDVVVRDSGLGRDGHDENVRKDRKACVEI